MRSSGTLTPLAGVINGLRYDGFTDFSYSGSPYLQRRKNKWVVVGVHYGRNEEGKYNVGTGVGWLAGPPPMPVFVPETMWSEKSKAYKERMAILESNLVGRGDYDTDDSYDQDRDQYHIGWSEDDEDDYFRRRQEDAEERAHGKYDLGAQRGVGDDSSFSAETTKDFTVHPAQVFPKAPAVGGEHNTPVTSKITTPPQIAPASTIVVTSNGPSPMLSTQTAPVSRWSDMPDPSADLLPSQEKPPSSKLLGEQLVTQQQMQLEIQRAAKEATKQANIKHAQALKEAKDRRMALAAARKATSIAPPASKASAEDAMVAKIAQAVAAAFLQQSSTTTSLGDPPKLKNEV